MAAFSGQESGTSDFGYVQASWATSNTPGVIWRQGERLPHMVSAEQEDYWILDPGYDFAADSTVEYPKAAWSPGKRHPSYPHIYAAPTESQWAVDAGYQWLSSESSDLRTFSPAQTWEAWRLASDIEASTHDINCTSDSAVLAVVEAARDRLGALDLRDVHPSLSQYLAAAQTALNDGATTISTCFVVSHAEDGADLAAALFCLFSDKTWKQCMDSSATTRKVIGLAGKLGSIPCDQAAQNFWKRLGELDTEQQHLQVDFRAKSGLQLTSPVRMVTCR